MLPRRYVCTCLLCPLTFLKSDFFPAFSPHFLLVSSPSSPLSSFLHSPLPFTLPPFLPLSSDILESQLYSTFFLCEPGEFKERKRDMRPTVFLCCSSFINGNFKRSQKNLFFSLPLLNGRDTSEVTRTPQGSLAR